MGREAGVLLIRADAGLQMGTGHVMRCLALCQAWQDLGGRAELITVGLPEPLQQRMEAEQCGVHQLDCAAGSLHDAQATAELAGRIAATAVVLDGYQFDEAYCCQLELALPRLLRIDDFGGHARGGMILNQNAWAAAADYPGCGPQTTLLAGSRYALLRREFASIRTARPQIRSRPERLLVSCGGSDPTQAVDRILLQLRDVSQRIREVVVVLGAVNERSEEVRSLAATLPFSVRIEQNCRNMSRLMCDADLAIAAAGTTSWEMACCGLPMISVVTAENQVRVAEAIAARGLGWNAGWMNEDAAENVSTLLQQINADGSALSTASERCWRQVDGRGAGRVAALLAAPVLQLRLAEAADSELLWRWRNEATVRQMSFGSEEIAWEDHSRWYSARLQRPDCEILIASNGEGKPIGQVRLDRQGDGAVISVSIAAEYRGCGYGATLIRLATNHAFVQRGLAWVDAMIREENVASQTAFLRAEYQRRIETTDAQQGLRFTAWNTDLQASNG